MRKWFTLLCAAVMAWGLMQAEETELLQNAGFETYEDQSTMFGNYSDFEGWERMGFSTQAEKNDVYEGAVALKLGATTMGGAYQTVEGLTDTYYADGSLFRIKIHYKVVGMTEKGEVSLDSYWEHATIDEGLKDHDAEVLQRVLSDTIQSEWQTLVIETTRPEQAKAFCLSFKTKAKCYVLLDSLSMIAVPSAPEGEPFIEVTPLKLKPVETTIGTTATFETLHIRQGYITGKTTFELSGYNHDQFRLSATEMPEGQDEIDLIITYAPTGPGTHTAIVNIDNWNHTALYQSVSLRGTCTDPSAQPMLTVTPSEPDTFEILEGKQQRQTLTLSSINCIDYVYARVEHVKGAAFTIDGSMFSKNSESTVTVTFTPVVAGTYQSTITFYSQDAEDVVVTLNGIGIEKTPETIDWQTDFVWDETNPLSVLDETFDDIKHNETLILRGWQNVAAVDARPWWGFDEEKTSPKRGTNRYAKATAYQYGKDSTGTWDMWLVTPALDYRNAPRQIFSFSVMGEYLAEEDNKAFFGVYYIDATGDEVYVQDLTAAFDIPSTADDNLTWRTFYMDLTPYTGTMADVFHMAFRYSGPNGAAGAVTYYVDNVSWGVYSPEGIETVSDESFAPRGRKILRDGRIIIMRNGQTFNLLGARVE